MFFNLFRMYVCQRRRATPPSTPRPDWTTNFPKSKPGPISFVAMKSSSTIRSSPLSAPKPACPISAFLTIRYGPDKNCLELKSLKEYLQSYRNLGIFQENIVNQVLEDVVRWAKPEWAEVKGDFRPRGDLYRGGGALAAAEEGEAPLRSGGAPAFDLVPVTTPLRLA